MTSKPPKCSSTSSTRSALSGPGNDGQRFSHLQSIIHTDIGREGFGKGVTTFWRKIIDEPDAFPPEFWQLFLHSSLIALGGKCRPVCLGMTWRRLITAGALRQWRPRLEEVNREVRQFGVAVPGGVEHVGLRARTLHETGNWLVLTYCSNQCLQQCQKDGVACRGSQLSASAHAACGQVLWHNTH